MFTATDARTVDLFSQGEYGPPSRPGASMPNWVDHYFEATDLSCNEALELAAAVEGDRLCEFLLPSPDWENIPNEEGVFAARIEGEVVGEDLEWPDGTQDLRWYQWNVENWGSKWDIDSGNADVTDNTVIGSFLTAWATVGERVLEAFASRYPQATLTVTYIEESYEYIGTHVVTKGAVYSVETDEKEVFEAWVKGQTIRPLSKADREELREEYEADKHHIVQAVLIAGTDTLLKDIQDFAADPGSPKVWTVKPSAEDDEDRVSMVGRFKQMLENRGLKERERPADGD